MLINYTISRGKLLAFHVLNRMPKKEHKQTDPNNKNPNFPTNIEPLTNFPTNIKPLMNPIQTKI
jgi:hypothetical protein